MGGGTSWHQRLRLRQLVTDYEFAPISATSDKSARGSALVRDRLKIIYGVVNLTERWGASPYQRLCPPLSVINPILTSNSLSLPVSDNQEILSEICPEKFALY
jgi:hypothetical protein